MALIILACCVVAFGAFMGIMLDRMTKAVERMNDRTYWTGEQCRNLANEQAKLGEKVDHVAAHFVYPPISEPVPLPSMDETEVAVRPKRKRK